MITSRKFHIGEYNGTKPVTASLPVPFDGDRVSTGSLTGRSL